MHFELKTDFENILRRITENNIQPQYHNYENKIAHYIFPLGNDIKLDFAHHIEKEIGAVHLTVSNCIHNFTITIGTYSQQDVPFVSADEHLFLTERDVYDFIISYV